MASAKVVRARSSFVVTVGKVEYLIHEGETYPANHPAVMANREAFRTEQPGEQVASGEVR